MVFGALAGLVSGPRMLKIVFTPSSADWRHGLHCQMMIRRKHETDANLADACAIWSGISMMLTPSDSSTSAAPLFDDTPRLPCLATLAPAAAATNIEAVEMLKVCDRSPPVPTMSIRLGSLSIYFGRQLAHHHRRSGDFTDGFPSIP